jgi:predicted PurR-regulated permease PerM
MALSHRLSEPVRAVLVAAALIGGWLLFRELVTLIVTALITVIVAIPLDAAARALERRGLPRWLGALLALFAGLALLAGVLALVLPPFISELQDFVDAVPESYAGLQGQIADLTGMRPGEVGDQLRDSLQGLLDEPSGLLGPAASIGLGVAGLLATFVLVLMTAYYIAVRPEPLVGGLVSLFPLERQPRVRAVLAELRGAWVGWLKGVAVDMAVTFVLLYVSLTLVGLDYAIVFAVLSALLVVVPYFGSIAGAIPPVLMALSESPEMALIVLGIYVLAQQVEGNLVVPLVMSRAVNIHPAVIVVGVVVVGRLLGFAGLFVAVPIISAALIIGRAVWVDPLRRTEAALEDETAAADTTRAVPVERTLRVPA